MYLGQLYYDGTFVQAQIYRNVGGTLTQLAAVLTNIPVGKAVTLEFEVQGSTLQLFVNGTLVTSAVDTQISGTGQTGILGTTGATFGDFNVNTLTYAITSETGWSFPTPHGYDI